jgi:hypothetical protein
MQYHYGDQITQDNTSRIYGKKTEIKLEVELSKIEQNKIRNIYRLITHFRICRINCEDIIQIQL